MQLPMVAAAERNSKFIADFQTKGPGLGEAQMMRIGRLASADKAWLRSNKPQIGFVAETFGFTNSQNALIDPSRE
jgi:hypothetical protein